jgi:hypothetical protein
MSRAASGGAATRPAPIVWFERLILATVALGILRSWLFPNNAWLSGIGDGGVISNLIAAVLVLVVMLRVSRWRSKVAMWLAILSTLVTLPMVVTSAMPFGLYPATGAKVPGWAWLGMGGAVLQIAACGLLLTRSARRWINREPTLEDLGETFS